MFRRAVAAFFKGFLRYFVCERGQVFRNNLGLERMCLVLAGLAPKLSLGTPADLMLHSSCLLTALKRKDSENHVTVLFPGPAD